MIASRRRIPSYRAWFLGNGCWLLVWGTWLSLYALEFVGRANGDPEEAANGNLARGVVEGLVASPWTYQYRPWAHGPFVYGLFLTPIYWLDASRMLWVKLIGAAFAVGGTAVWFRLVRRGWGAAAAALFAAWWVFPPPYLRSMLHVAWANHMESILLSGLLFLALLRCEDTPPAPRRAFGIGLLAGIASFFCLQNVVAGAAVATVMAWRYGRRALGGLAALAAGAALGFSPHWLHRLATGLGPGVMNRRAAGIVEQVAALVTRVFPQDAGYSWRLASAAAAALWGAGALLGLFRWSRTPRATDPGRSGEAWLGRLLLVYLGLWLAAYGVGRFHVEDPDSAYWRRYLMPLFPVGMALAAFALSRLPRRSGWIVLAPFLALGAVEQKPWLLLRDGPAGPRLEEARLTLLGGRGDDFWFFVRDGLPFHWRTRGSCARERADETLAAVARLPRSWRADGDAAFGRCLGPSAALDVLKGGFFEREPGRAADLAFGMGMAAAEVPFNEEATPARAAEIVRETATALAGIGGELSVRFLRGVGYRYGELMGPVSDARRYARLSGKSGRDDAVPGLESNLLARLRPVHEFGRALNGALSDPGREAFARGFGRCRGFARDARFADDGTGPPSLAELTGVASAPRIRASVERGYAEGRADWLRARVTRYAWRREPAGWADTVEALRAAGIAVHSRQGRRFEVALSEP